MLINCLHYFNNKIKNMWRYYWSWKYTTDNYSKTLNIEFLKKYWYLDKWVNEKSWWLYWKINWEDNWNIWVEVNKWETNWYIRVHFTQTNSEWVKKQLDYKINLTATKCNYWWVRWWFLCPCKWNRCSILYLQNNWIFASRKTLDLCYSDQKQSKKYRELNNIFISDNIERLMEKIKYPYRNWKPTRKMKRVLKLRKKELNIDKDCVIQELLYK